MRLAGTTRATQHSLNQRMAYRILLNSTTTNELPTEQESDVILCKLLVPSRFCFLHSPRAKACLGGYCLVHSQARVSWLVSLAVFLIVFIEAPW